MQQNTVSCTHYADFQLEAKRITGAKIDVCNPPFIILRLIGEYQLSTIGRPLGVLNVGFRGCHGNNLFGLERVLYKYLIVFSSTAIGFKCDQLRGR